jgi:hypothetical protein
MNTEENDYEVGYRKPPVATRFKKGQISQNVCDSRNATKASKISVLRAADELLKQNQTN